MSTIKLDTAYSAFIMEVVPLLSQMKEDELTDLLSDITSKMDSMIDGARETARDFEQEMRSDMEEPREIEEDDERFINS